MNVDDLRPTLDAAAENPALWKSLVITAFIWIGALGLRTAVVSFLRSRGLPPTELRRLMATSRNTILFILAVATATVWFDELRTFAVSLVAVAAAIVIATKELIMGAGGTFLRTSGRIFDIGDRIEVASLRGDVVDTSLFTTTLLEIGPGRIGHQQMGRAITIPNAMLLTTPVVNETWSRPFLIHTFEVPVPRERALAAEALLLEACVDEAGVFVDDARRHFEARQRERGIEMPILDPRVLIRIDDASKATLIAAVVVPTHRKGVVEQAILRRFLALEAMAPARSTTSTSTTTTTTTSTATATDVDAAG